ncbi:unnamed protein product [Pleuronectes platessa]|uniref:Uncharacterized protein n=1 Tax=Pleuronectes platessa TaxID=8262 RepID=A0A9N7VRR0_PLEPL|nr:unnamed protein product [Pleuronectes platessa]
MDQCWQQRSTQRAISFTQDVSAQTDVYGSRQADAVVLGSSVSPSCEENKFFSHLPTLPCTITFYLLMSRRPRFLQECSDSGWNSSEHLSCSSDSGHPCQPP